MMLRSVGHGQLLDGLDVVLGLVRRADRVDDLEVDDESMLTIRLSSVITPWGGNGHHVLAHVQVVATLSMIGTTRCGPGSKVRLNLPNRSTTPTRCWRITRIAAAQKTITARQWS
jgi:hypothetical protein